ncbi:MAG TPA: hypothetical protein VGO80_01145 [Solirubrobacteraceae bacterium]|nr:hypothetical protein [Solirubrobacteraceae bacterium]
MLATGYLLTWARIASEGLPSQAILTALPRTYFVITGVESMLSPLVIAIAVAPVWVRCAMWLSYDRGRTAYLAGWAGFGMCLGIVSATVATWVNKAEFRPPTISLVVPAASTALVLAPIVGEVVRRARPADVGGHAVAWARRRRTVLAAATVLCFAVPCAVRIVDARYIGNGLPFTQVVLQGPCTRLTNSIRPQVVPTPVVGAAEGPGCQVGGFFLGSSEQWIFLAQRQNPCPRDESPAPPQLVMLAPDRVATLVARDTPPPVRSCPGRARR